MNKDFIETLIDRINTIREERGYSVEYMCNASEVATSTWGKLNGLITQDPKIGTVIRIAECLGVSVSYLIGETEYKTIDNGIVLKELADFIFQ